MEPTQRPRMNETRRRRTRKSIKDYDLIFGTWNIRTMLQAGKMMEIADELRRYKTAIAALQEIRWKGQGEIRKKSFSIYYSGSERSGHYGVGFYVEKNARNCVLDFEPISNRIAILNVKGKFNKITILSVYAPTEDKDDSIKDEFYDVLLNTVQKISRHNTILILGDFNAKIGKEEFIEEVARKHSLHNHTSENGNRMVSLAESAKLWISSVSFPRKNIYKQTWVMPGSRDANQIDHILIDKRHANSIINVRSRRGANCDSDHYLVACVLRQRISNVISRNNYKKDKWNLDGFKNRQILERYQSMVVEKLRRISINEIDIDEKWSTIKASIKESATATVGTKRSTRNDEWFDEECREAIAQKNIARERMMSRNTRQNLKEYHQKRKIAKKLIQKKKRESLKKQIQQIEISGPGNARKFYSKIKHQRSEYMPRLNICKDAQGNLISEEGKVLTRWKNYFQDLLNNKNEDISNNRTQSSAIQSAEILVEPPTIDEISLAIKKLKNGKASGEDGITAELIKNGPTELQNALFCLTKHIWESEIIPKEWQTSIIIPIYKKGDRRDCNNYRGISLLSTAYKIFTNVLHNRLNDYAEQILGEYQCGFRNGRSTTDQSFVVCQIFEKFHEHKINLHALFIDFLKAFDSIERSKIEYVLRMQGIPKKLASLVSLTLAETYSKVLMQGKTSDLFKVESGVKQGDALSTLVFNLILDHIIKEVDPTGTIFNKASQICGFADDLVIFARNINVLKEVFQALRSKAKFFGLKINENKTKYLARLNTLRKAPDLRIGDHEFESVDEIKYLGLLLSRTGDTAIAIQDRVQAANRTYFAHVKLLKSKLLSRKTKIKIYKTLIRPVATYGCETWTLKVNAIKQLSNLERRILRRILGPVREGHGVYRIRYNCEIEEFLQGENVVRFAKSQRIRWLGHVCRMQDERIPHKVLDARLLGEKRRGRPRKRWLDDVEDDLRSIGVTNYRSLAMDRDAWRRIVEEAKAHNEL